MSSKIFRAGVQTASPQYLSLGKDSLSSTKTLAPPRDCNKYTMLISFLKTNF